MTKPRRVITITLPHREPALAAILSSLLLVVILAGPLLHLLGIDLPEEEEAPRPGIIPNVQLASLALNARVDDLLRKMTLAEKIGQLTQYSGGELTGPDMGPINLDKLIAQGQVGSLFNVVGAQDTNRYQKLAVEKSPLHIPLLFGFDVIHGERTIFPVPLALASTYDLGLVEQVSREAGKESAADGIRWVFSPMVDIARDARWGRMTEGAGEDTFLGSQIAGAYVRGYQGSDLSKPTAVAACVKHFAAYGAPNAGREYNTVDMSELTLRQVYLPPYQAAVDNGAATVMSAFNPLNGVPATADPFTLTKILRQEWKFDGFVTSDFGAVRELIAHGVASNGAIAAKKALTSGVDMDMMSDLYRTRLEGLVNSGELPESVVTEAARRVLRVKFALGLFEHPYADETGAPYKATAEKRALARRAAEESLVLLKNGARPVPFAAGKVLPLPRTTATIALIGPLADSPDDMLGSWSAAGDPADAVTLRAALQARCNAAKTRLIYAQGTEILTDSEAGFAEAIAAARQADAVVLALGESAPKMTGESTSVTRLDLPGNQERLLETITALGKPTVLVLFDGRPLAIKWAAAHVPAILEAWYPGIEAGPAVADVLFGDTNPSGKLTTTFPRAVGQEPLFYNQLPTGRPADDIDLTHPPTGDDKYYSRYIDETNAPLFPFGYGLSYTTFEYTKLRLSQATIPVEVLERPRATRYYSPPNQIVVTAHVKNTGPVTGTEVVQLYIRNTGGSVEEPVRELRGFQRVTLKPGETRQVQFSLGFNELSYYNLEMERVIEPTNYQVWVGDNSNATLGGQFEVTEK
ncbi:MAG: beta-glucosidase BglX [Verrucomicrobiota bacterium]